MTNYKNNFKNPGLVILGISESISNTGNWITMMAVYSMLIFGGKGNVAESSGVLLAGLLPLLVFSPVAGWLVDRFDRRRLMIAGELLAGAVICGLIFLDNIFWIYTIIAAQAIFISVMTPARQAVIAHLVEKEDLPGANAFLQQLAGIIKITAPLLAGFVLAVLDPHQAIILDAISFGLSAMILSRLPKLPPPSQRIKEVQAGGVEKTRLSWVRILQQLPALQLLMAATWMSITVIIGLDVLAPVYIREILSGNERLFGAMVSMIGAGTLTATLVLMLRSNQKPWRDLIAGILLLTCIPTVMGIVIQLPDDAYRRWIVLGGCLVGGFGNGLIMVQSTTLLQTLSPAAFLGRMGGVYQGIAVSGQLAGMLLTPLLIPDIISMSGYFFLSVGLLGLVAAFIFYCRKNRPEISSEEGIDIRMVNERRSK